jgi:hypothetical protein
MKALRLQIVIRSKLLRGRFRAGHRPAPAGHKVDLHPDGQAVRAGARF